MRPQVEEAIQASYTPNELQLAIREAGISGVRVDESDANYVVLQRRGETDPNSWVTTREQYR
jgi:hypothetical protein